MTVPFTPDLPKVEFKFHGAECDARGRATTCTPERRRDVHLARGLLRPRVRRQGVGKHRVHRVRATRRDRLSLPSTSLSASAIARDPRPLGRHLLTPSHIITARPRCPDAENTDRYLSEVEMKLQLLAEDISLALEEQSLAGLQRIPARSPRSIASSTTPKAFRPASRASFAVLTTPRAPPVSPFASSRPSTR